MSGPVLQLDAVRLTRGSCDVLLGASFNVARGELVALMGPSGSGKTTILRAIAGLEPFAAGRIVIGDIVLGPGPLARAAARALHRRVGMVFQFHCLFEHLSSARNVWLAPVHAHGVERAEAERRARDLLRGLGVEHRADAFPRELSGGEAQRVAIARALAVDPAVLLMDEPTASLDPARRTELAELVRDLAAQGRTLVIATHDEEFARTSGARVLKVERGRVE